MTIWFIAAGLLVVYGFLRWEGRLEAAARRPEPCSRWCGRACCATGSSPAG